MLVSSSTITPSNHSYILDFIQKLLDHMPSDWLELTTHRLDIYNESLAKIEFLDHLEILFQTPTITPATLSALPTAYDYIRLGHPLSCILEWSLAKMNGLDAEQVISFASVTMPLLAILRTNRMRNKKTRLVYDQLPACWNTHLLQQVYGYQFELVALSTLEDLPDFDGSTVLLLQSQELQWTTAIDFVVYLPPHAGSILLIQGDHNRDYSAAIQHVRRRETVAMTPNDCLVALQQLVGTATTALNTIDPAHQTQVWNTIQHITGTTINALVGSSGLSMQYAIMMGLVHEAQEKHPNKTINIIIPPNCYGGTNDQARRVAASIDNVTIVDLPVDGDQDMVQSIDLVLNQIAAQDAISYIIAEIPTNPRVEVPDLKQLRNVLSKERLTPNGHPSLRPVFILDQTFCPNVSFSTNNSLLAGIQTISYASGSKFPSGGKCTAGYCIANQAAAPLLEKIGLHLTLCDNGATPFQWKTLAQQFPSMLERIQGAYQNARSFVQFIEATLPEANINFVSEALAQQEFTPSVFSLDLPTKGATEAERETYKRTLNQKLIHMMITKIPTESKFCVSYGQLKGCYWTIPATSTQGTTKEADKDYIVRVALSPNLDLERHKTVFEEFVASIRPL